jgi:hypothetical protein
MQAGSAWRPAGHTILPVFVLSLMSMPYGLLLDRKSLHVTTSRCVLVLQTEMDSVEVPYKSESKPVYLDPRSPTRHVVAGLATALGGVSEPYARFSVEKGSQSYNYLWAIGSVAGTPGNDVCYLCSVLIRIPLCCWHYCPLSAVPWGPLSNSTSLSLLFADLSVRNGVTARISGSMFAVQKAMKSIRDFHAEFIEDSSLAAGQLSLTALAPLGTPDNSGVQQDRDDATVVARDTSVRLARELQGIEQQFLHLSGEISNHRCVWLFCFAAEKMM